ncbi:hypothetical protein [Halorubrum sp. Atlit-28R]|uniref:hypothetical protein n=1 Tax=Halorubrum sp. Atlit-28R TaxID=2282129 RepID=UPI000EF1C708|nr:hypothetical protein [Halorubrum sp. Atlit-28R]RLM49439.1 hypothetical protein DVK06_14795 [Halorubrum sp. Atlit-28R]
MSSNTESHDSTDSVETIQPYCGHTVLRSETFLIGELRVCRTCFLNHSEPWFDIDDYPTVLQTEKRTAHEGRATSTVTSHVRLLGITTDRTVIYHDEIDDQFWTVVPAHSEYHDTEDAIRTPLREVHSDCTLGAPASHGDDDFHTLPNGDHLALLEVAEAPYSIREWLVAHDDEFRQLADYYTDRSQ